MALGATSADILRLMLGRGVALTAIGLAAGLVGALAATQLLTEMLFGVKPTDSATYIAVVGLLSATSAIAVLIPSRRATRVDPVVTLRDE
jgi:putative ABC transport system permease protein